MAGFGSSWETGEIGAIIRRTPYVVEWEKNRGQKGVQHSVEYSVESAPRTQKAGRLWRCARTHGNPGREGANHAVNGKTPGGAGIANDARGFWRHMVIDGCEEGPLSVPDNAHSSYLAPVLVMWRSPTGPYSPCSFSNISLASSYLICLCSAISFLYLVLVPTTSPKTLTYLPPPNDAPLISSRNSNPRKVGDSAAEIYRTIL